MACGRQQRVLQLLGYRVSVSSVSSQLVGVQHVHRLISVSIKQLRRNR